MGIMDSKTVYKAPHAKLIELYVQDFVCQSPNTGAVNSEGYTEEQLNW